MNTTTQTRQRKKPTKFQLKWGYDVHWFAKKEGVTPAAIQMRVMNWGNPFCRKPNPTMTEISFRKTVAELAEELELHPQTVLGRIVKTGNPYDSKTGYVGWSRGQNLGGIDWRQSTQWGKQRSWLMPEHPLHDAWRDGKVDWQEVLEGGHVDADN